MKLSDVIQIKIMESAYFKMNQYFKLAENELGGKEVGGLFETEIKNNVFTLKDTILLDQEVSGADFEIDEKALTQFTKEIFLTEPKKLGSYKSWWHRHPCTKFSSQDDETFDRLGKVFKGNILGLVLQSNGVIFGRVVMYNRNTKVVVETIKLEIIKESFNKKKIAKFCKRQFKKKVKVRVYEKASDYPSIYGYSAYDYMGYGGIMSSHYYDRYSRRNWRYMSKEDEEDIRAIKDALSMEPKAIRESGCEVIIRENFKAVKDTKDFENRLTLRENFEEKASVRENFNYPDDRDNLFDDKPKSNCKFRVDEIDNKNKCKIYKITLKDILEEAIFETINGATEYDPTAFIECQIRNGCKNCEFAGHCQTIKLEHEEERNAQYSGIWDCD